MSAQFLETRALKYEFEVTMRGSRDLVWSTLTEATTDWWLPEFHMVGPESKVTLDARAGGQLLEVTAGGDSLLWYTVIMCLPQKALHLVGHVGPNWGGPATTMLTLSLQDRDEGRCTLRVQDALFGHLSEQSARSLEDGWRQLFENGLKTRVEA
ncbi:MAG: hypothetical protein KDB53_00860 [Planctomycetes bacterium]|nr:hypothetical protein [Planctomycetota bacterium]